MPRLPSVTIPSADQLDTREFSEQRAILRPDVSSVGKGLASFGQSMQDVGKTMGEYWDNKTDFEVAEAEAKFLIEKEKLTREMDHDKDYSTMPDRWSKNISDKLSSVSESIRDGNKKAAFLQRQNVRIESSRSEIINKAFLRERDDKRGRLNESLNSIRDAAIDGNPEDMQQWIEAGANMITSANMQDFYGDEEADKIGQTWRNDVTIKKLESMNPRDALKVVDSPLVQYLPADVKITMTKKLSDKLLDEDAAAWVDDNYTGDIATARVNVASIENPDLRAKAESRLDYTHNTRLKDKAVKQDEIYRIYGGQVVDGKISATGLKNKHPDVWDEMSVGMKENLLAIERQGGLPPTHTSFNVTRDLLTLKASGNWGDLAEYVQNNSAQMSEKDRRDYMQIAIDGTMPRNIDSKLSDADAVIGNMDGMKISKEEKARYIGKIGEWRMGYIEQNGKEPNDRERDDQIKLMMREVDTSGKSWEWGSTKKVSHMDSAQFNIAQKVDAYFKGQGKTPTNEEFDALFEVTSDLDTLILEEWRKAGVERPTVDEYNRGLERLMKLKLQEKAK